jgi:7-cyano-7-deazaguanine synthase
MKAVISLSGGMDSTTLLAQALSDGRKCSCVSFTYGSKHNKYENEAARKVAKHFRVELDLIDLSSFMSTFRSALLKEQGEIPEGHYEAETMSQTVVPGRNIIFTSVLSGYAWSKEIDEVWIGIHAGDHEIYADCRPEFFNSMSRAIEAGTNRNVELRAPFLSKNKTSIIKLGRILGVPYELTRTCYKDQEIACGRCGACQERLEAFRNNGIEDPIPYEFREALPRE